MEYTLKLFRLLLDKRPVGLPEEVLGRGEAEYERLKKEAKNAAEVEAAMIEFGKDYWPYRQATEEFKAKYGKKKREEMFVSLLPADLKQKWDQFTAQGGSIHNYRQGREFEDFFTAEENLKIENAFVEADQAVYDFVFQLAEGEKSEEYSELVQKYRQERDEILAKIAELDALQTEGNKWDEEIQQEVYYFQKGFAELEERPSSKKVQGKIDWYQGQIDMGNK